MVETCRLRAAVLPHSYCSVRFTFSSPYLSLVALEASQLSRVPNCSKILEQTEDRACLAPSTPPGTERANEILSLKAPLSTCPEHMSVRPCSGGIQEDIPQEAGHLPGLAACTHLDPHGGGFHLSVPKLPRGVFCSSHTGWHPASCLCEKRRECVTEGIIFQLAPPSRVEVQSCLWLACE